MGHILIPSILQGNVLREIIKTKMFDKTLTDNNTLSFC